MIRISQGYTLVDGRDAAMFVARRRLFVDLLRWDIPVTDGRFEIDQFDGPDATYLSDIGDDGAHRGSLRLLPSDRPHLLSELFSALCFGPVPRGAGIAEVTRLCLSPNMAASERLVVRNRLISAMVDHALATEIRTLTGVVRASFRDAILEIGRDAMPLGPERNVSGTKLGAFRIEIDIDTPGQLARTGIYMPMASLREVAA